eukprot:CAMPEP_0172455752 /NCGR_PEP_ID=MMETSP1065-20121228/12228_1 /TAXON_ID=265537 /ORGANISM="Amphiprora paludosa, Strain CCMP125" /LENGTH=499 /DNA_ID=CAMNT_0013208225 /DNA_START=255 /DNA_END=1754 /DNA_ORIENTATION=-
MSRPSSGSSTPRGGATPPPGEGPSPLMVATSFIKRYYRGLSENPDDITRLYHSSSIFSVGFGSEHAQPEAYESLQGKQLKDRFFPDGFENWTIGFEFKDGAIDAQTSANGGVLLVATGHVVYVPPANGLGEDLQQRRKGFVHTFFLGSMTVGGKKTFAVQNDILRFLQDDEEKTVVASNTTEVSDLLPPQTSVQLPATVEEPPPTEVIPEPVVEEPEEEPISDPVVELEPVDTSPGGGVEESKEQLMEEEEPTAGDTDGNEAIPVEEPAAEVAETEENATPAPKPPPGSWASIAANAKNGSTAPTPSAPSTPARSTTRPTQPKPSTPSPSPAATTTATKPPAAAETNTNKPETTRQKHQKRDPDCTLVIKNITAETTDSDIRGLFEGYAAETGTKLIGSTVFGSRSIAFMDYDSPKPVLAAVEKAKENPIQLFGRTLDIYQKTAEQQKSRRNQGGGRGYRGVGGQPGNGRGQYRRSGSGAGRGDRGGGGRGGGGRGARP